MKRVMLALMGVVSAGVVFAQEVASNAYRFGSAAASRPRMVVVNFRPANGDTFSWYGQNESSAMWAGTLADKLNERFTQTRAFNMIDRKFDAEIQDEIRRLSDKNAAKGDVIRLCQRLGTDYMVVGDVKFWPIQPPAVNALTGQALPAAPQQFAEVSYRVIIAPTGQIEWAATIMLSSGDFPAGDIASFSSMSADGAACRIVQEVMANLFPAPAAVPAADAAPATAPAPTAAPAVASPGDTTVRGTGNGGVVTPF